MLTALLVIALILGISLISFVGIYNFPAADDFAMVLAAQEKGFWQAQIDWYTQWSGKYTGVFLASLVPIEELSIYRAMPVLLLLGITTALYFSSQKFFKSLTLGRRESLTLGCLFILCFLCAMPSLNQGLFWVSGAFTYMSSSILILTLMLLLFSKWSPFRIALAIILCLLIPGMNETGLMILIYSILAVGTYKYVTEKKIDRILASLAGICFFASLVVFFAPGNSIRFPNFPWRHNFFEAVLRSPVDAVEFIIRWLSFPPTVLFSLAFLATFTHAFKGGELPFPLNNRRVLLVNVFLVVCFGLFPSEWAMKGPPPVRAINVIYLAFLVNWTVLLISLSKIRFLQSLSEVRNWMPLFFLLALAFNKNNFQMVASNIFKGTAKNYAAELEARAELIRSCTEDPCEVPPLKYHPASIYFDDITEDLNDWRNQSYSKFHGKNIRLSSQSSIQL